MNHKDGNPENNVISNVELLCRNCHGLTSTHKGKNRGSGREFRREYRRLQKIKMLEQELYIEELKNKISK